MPVATTTAIAAGASLASAGASFAQAAKQSRLQREASEAAAKYMEEAKKKYGVNYLEAVQVPLEGYETAARVNQAAASQSLEAMKESGQRAILGGVGRLQEQTQMGAEQLRMAMQEDLYNRDLMVAQEEGRLRDELANIEMVGAAGAQQAAADAAAAKAQAMTSAFSSLGDAASTAYEGAALYSKQKGVDDFINQYTPDRLLKSDRDLLRNTLMTMSDADLAELYQNGKKSKNYVNLFGKFTVPDVPVRKVPGVGVGAFGNPKPYNPFGK